MTDSKQDAANVGSKRNILDWFDIHNRDHLESWNVLLSTGRWPEWFPEEMDFPVGWFRELRHKMADAWVTSVLSRRDS